LKIGIYVQVVELVDLQALQLGRAELLKSLQDLGAGGDESGVGSSRKPLPSPHFHLFLAARDSLPPLYLCTIFRKLSAATPLPTCPPYSGS
jgi:hypothetical protein